MDTNGSRRRHARGIGAWALTGLMMAADPAATAPMDPAALAAYGGKFAVDCADARSPRLRVTAEALILEHDGRRTTAAPVQVMASFYGPNPPPGYVTALSAPTSRSGELLLVLFRDGRGRHLRVDGDEPVRAALGRLADARYRDCRPAAVAHGRSPLADAGFRAAYERALGHRAGEPWIRAMVGQATTPGAVTLAGTHHEMYSVCKPHDCADHQLVLLFSRERGVAYGRLRENGRSPRWVGDPPPALRPHIERLFREQWPTSP